jgi:tRNA-modifying protein YgfZ
MRSDYRTVCLDQLGVLSARGPDLLPFLQGQLSNDIALLSPQRSLLAGYHNPQGRVIALLRLLQPEPGQALAVLPRELIGPVIARLSKFVLRAKVKLADESAQWNISGLLTGASAADPQGTCAGDGANFAAILPTAQDAAAHLTGAIAVCVARQPARWLLLRPASPAPLTDAAAAAPEEWQRLAIAAGEPQVYRATSEEFVAQMLNLDALGAIAFDKGCYTGQEVIARAHYRGRVKRRMQRFVTLPGQQPLQVGEAGELSDGRAFRAVDAVMLADGRCEFLAVAPLQAVAPLETGEADAVPPTERGATGRVDAQTLPLPYALPS